jgi:DNA mismatch repair protein MutL
MPFGLPEEVQPVKPAPVQERPSAFADYKPPVMPIASEHFPVIDASDDTEEFPEESARPQTYIPPVPSVQPAAPAEELRTEPFPDVKVVGELFANYILAQSGETFIIIDKHAAHERVIFERLRKENCKQYQQMLLEPCRVLLTMDEFTAMEENTALLERLGFAFDFSRRPFAVATAAPIFFDGLNLDEIVQELAHNLFLGKVNPQSHALDDMLHEMACKSAIKANDRNSTEELQALAERVCNDESIRHCPHGRPVMFTMSKYNLERQFRRRV